MFSRVSQATSKGPKICYTSSPQKGVGESASPILREEGRDPELQEQCWQVMCQIDTITVASSPAKPLPSKLELKEGEVKTSVVLDLVAPTPMSPSFLPLPMDQCGLRLNEQGELVLTYTKSPCNSPPTTL